MDKHLHIIALNIPFPPNYGGVIDIYYKIKALHQLGVKIILHCFEYERPQAEELQNLCERVYYYKRKTGIISNLSILPYNVKSRISKELVQNLLKDTYPILGEGLHTFYYLQDQRFANRYKVFRECNIEHNYYQALAQATSFGIKKLFYLIESIKFKLYEKQIQKADLIIAVSQTDTEYLKKLFPNNVIDFVPCFHANDQLNIIPGKSDYLLYHGKLSVEENEKAALFLIKNVYAHLPYTCIIAGMSQTPALYEAAASYPNIKIEANPSQQRMDELIKNAHIHTLVTFQGTGLKLKLLNSLFSGRFIVANSLMLNGSNLEDLCHIANTSKEFISICDKLMQQPFDIEEIENRKKKLFPFFSNQFQAERICRRIFNAQ